MNCLYAGRCSGCGWIELSIAVQRTRKITALAETFPGERVRWLSCGDQNLRDRVDLTWTEGKLGLFDLDRERGIVDLQSCPMMTVDLQKWFIEYRSNPPPQIRRGSVRLRVAPDGTRGVWLDFANADVKHLFEQREYLFWLSELAIVEIGQRRKRLHWVDGAPKLRDPQLFRWFDTFDRTGRPIPLYGVINSFTQTGVGANRVLTAEVLRLVEESGITEWLDLFAGNGNFSLALRAGGLSVSAVESDELAVESLQRSCAETGTDVPVLPLDLYVTPSLPDAPGWIADPPRSGLKGLLAEIERSRPQCLIYVSCWTDSFTADAVRLKGLGFELEELSAVDQFVHSAHVEWVGRFRRANN